MSKSKIVKIIESDFRTGIKNGKEWRLMKVELEDGTTATGFAPASEGDEVEVSPSDYGLQFKTLKKKSGSSDAGDDVHKYIVMQLKALVEGQDTILAMLTDIKAATIDKSPGNSEETIDLPPDFLET